ncbi:MAG: DNA polymerase III subunit alpha, partial [Calditrichia bacterium]|nr:DNA polymerase III subunit alpha [Calditrichia bacterium]
TYNTFQFRSSIRDVAKIYGIPEEEIKLLTAYLPHYTKGNLRETLENLPEYQHLRHQFHMYEKILEICEKLKNFPRHLSIHAGGIIIAPGKISRFLPVEEAGKGLVISQYDMYSVEKLGLVKMDFLGVRSLTIISDTVESIRQLAQNGRIKKDESDVISDLPQTGQLSLFSEAVQRAGEGAPDIQTLVYTLNPVAGKIGKRNLKEYFCENKFPFLQNLSAKKYSILDLKSIPEDDASVIELLRNGKSMGCFQLESPGMRALLQKMQMKNMYDVIVSIALIRPGAANSGMKDVYIRRRAGVERTTYVHSSLEKILQDTYGVVIYQEQVMQIAHEVADISLAKADSLRRAMTKHRSKREIHDLQNSFIEGLQKKNISIYDATRLWKYLLNFTGYGFNKAHSATYGMIAYQSAYLKRYFPVAFMTAVLNNHGGFYSKMAYIEEIRRMGITVLLPDINKSEKNFTFFENTIRVGLNSIYELSYKTVNRILQYRKTYGDFKDIFEFLKTINPAKHEAVNLAKAGTFSSVMPSQPQALAAANLFFSGKKNVNQARLLLQQVNLRSYSLQQRILYEMEILDFAVSAHPLTLFKEFLPRNAVPGFALLQHRNKTVTIYGWIVTSRRLKTEK